MTETARKDPSAWWFEQRLAFWQRTDTLLDRLERGKSASRDAVFGAVRAYPEIARDLTIARRTAPESRLTKHLARIYLELHRAIFRRPERIGASVRALFERDAARAAHALRRHILAVAALFWIAAGAGYWLVDTHAELAALFASEAMIEHVARGELWTDGLLNVFPSSLLAIQIFTNNIAVSLFALCFGVFYGLGTFYIIGMNGLMLGGVFALTAQHAMARRLFEFVAAHGFVEISVIVIAGAIGASLGEALARPGHLGRGAALRAATIRAAPLAAVCVVFLIGAGTLEGYVSPDPAFTLAERLAIGLGYFSIFALVLTGALGRRRLALGR